MLKLHQKLFTNQNYVSSLVLSTFITLSFFSQAKLEIQSHVLDNGLTLLAVPKHDIPQVMLTMVVGVGSKDEGEGEAGMAHLIEHMLFKGTTKSYSEGDIDCLTHRISGKNNAATSFDWTHYWYKVPAAYWKEMVPLMAEQLNNCAFKEDQLNAEFKVVIQELKQGRDDYARTASLEMLNLIFKRHPYGRPVIGYKQDIWDLHAEDLHRFYKKHYWPNNAALVVVGDIDAKAFFKECEKHFGSIEPNFAYSRKKNAVDYDIVSKNTVLYRAVHQPSVTLAYCLPVGNQETKDLYTLLPSLLGCNAHNRISKRLVDDEQLVLGIGAVTYQLMDQCIFRILYTPKNEQDKDKIDQIIQEEINKIIEKGLDDSEINNAIKVNKSAYYNNLQSNMNLALQIAHAFIEGEDPRSVFTYLENTDTAFIKKQVVSVLKAHLRSTKRFSVMILPLQNEDEAYWLDMQKKSDEEDAAILEQRKRTTEIEAPKEALKVQLKECESFNYAKPSTYKCKNGLKLLYHSDSTIPKIEIKLRLKVDHYYDPQNKNGLNDFTTALLDEGTHTYSKAQLMKEFESRGMLLAIDSNEIHLSVLSTDLECALSLLKELLVNASFPQEAIEKVRAQLHTNVDSFWDSPRKIAQHIAGNYVYKDTVLGKHELTHASIDAITREDIIAFYKDFMSPKGASLAIVGDIGSYNVTELVEKTIGHWNGKQIKDLSICALQPHVPTELTHFIPRDQVMLWLCGPSVDLKHPDYYKLLVADQIFGAGLLGAIQSSRLFQLRVQHGIFYTPVGSLIANASLLKNVPGTVSFGSLISVDRLEEGVALFKQLADTLAESITQEEIDQAKRNITYATVDRYANNGEIADTFIRLDWLELPFDYYDKRTAKIKEITLDEVKEAVRKVLHSSKLSVVKVGRVSQAVKEKPEVSQALETSETVEASKEI